MAKKILVEVEVLEGVDEEEVRKVVRKMFKRRRRIFGILRGLEDRPAGVERRDARGVRSLVLR